MYNLFKFFLIFRFICSENNMFRKQRMRTKNVFKQLIFQRAGEVRVMRSISRFSIIIIPKTCRIGDEQDYDSGRDTQHTCISPPCNCIIGVDVL
jgi:hypothetical protein